MKKTGLCFLFFLLILAAYPQYDGSYAGARQAGMGGAAVTLHDTWSVLNNPAGLSFAENISAGIFYENRYVMKEFSSRGMAVQVPTESGNFGFGFTYFGFSLYNEKRFTLAYGRKLFPRLSAGLSFDYLHTQLEDEKALFSGSRGVITFQAGLQAQLSDKVRLAFSLFNPYMAQLSEYENEKIPAIARFGVSYKPDDKFLLIAEAEQNLKHDLRFKAGAGYNLHKKIVLRGGIKTNPAEYTMGIGMELNGFVFDISTAYHLVLGNSPHGSFIYEF